MCSKRRELFFRGNKQTEHVSVSQLVACLCHHRLPTSYSFVRFDFTFKTGVRNSATPRAVPFTVFMTFCILRSCCQEKKRSRFRLKRRQISHCHSCFDMAPPSATTRFEAKFAYFLVLRHFRDPRRPSVDKCHSTLRL